MAHPPTSLPSPADIAYPWAACAAISAAIKMPASCFADPESGYWHYDDGGGNWVRMLRGQRGWLLVGWDREDPRHLDGATVAVPPPGSPPWWSETLDVFADSLKPWQQYISGPSFIDAYADTAWHSPQATLAATEPMQAPLTAERARSVLVDILLEYDVGFDRVDHAMDTLISEGPNISADHLAELNARGLDPAAGAAAASKFITPGQARA